MKLLPIVFLIFNVTLLVNTKTINDQPKTHEITIKTVIGNILTFRIDENHNVEELKKLIYENTEIPVEKQILFYKGKALDDFQDLGKYKLGKRCTLELFLRYF
ncbi:hypothetical protein HHI36_021569 [Cryptolaemus montrouzieri]|uniref:Ubiquitin-like domain-containing protein n=1 Tax=Cryptolaemus montrouzieri TaxID=559131 RepID=A0ABD2MXZ8_9CUCU